VARKRDRLFPVRLGIILAVGTACIIAAAIYGPSGRRTPAPPETQEEGIALVRDILRRVRPTEFGRSPRGTLLSETIEDFLQRGRLIFTPDIASQALYRREGTGYAVLYVKALRIGGRVVHQTPEEVAEGIYHEAVHASQRHEHGSSIEEECDGFCAGLCAGAAVTGRAEPELLTIEGAPLAQFVTTSYPELPRKPDYQPVSASLDWLKRRTGLR